MGILIVFFFFYSRNGSSWAGRFDHDMKMGGGVHTSPNERGAATTRTFYWRDRKVCA